MRIKRIHWASQGFLFGVETVHPQKRAVAVQQPALKGGDIYGSQIIFKEDAILARRAVGHVGLVFKQGKDHAEGYKKLGQVPEETSRGGPFMLRGKKRGYRENAAPDDERSGGKDHAGGEAAEVPEIDKPGHIEEAEQVKVDSMSRMAQVSLAHDPASIGQQHVERIQVRTAPAIKTRRLKCGVDVADGQQAYKNPLIVEVKKIGGEIKNRSCADQRGESDAPSPVNKDLGNGKQKEGPGNDQGGYLDPDGITHHPGQEVIEGGSSKMDEDSNPAQHPEAGSLLPVAGVNPGKERHQDADYAKDNQFLKSGRHKDGSLTPILHTGLEYLQVRLCFRLPGPRNEQPLTCTQTNLLRAQKNLANKIPLFCLGRRLFILSTKGGSRRLRFADFLKGLTADYFFFSGLSAGFSCTFSRKRP